MVCEHNLSTTGRRPGAISENIKRAEAKHYQRIAKETVAEPLPFGTGEVFLDRHRVDIALAPAIQVAGGSVMNRVLPTPVEIGRERQHADDRANNVIGRLILKRTRARSRAE